MDSNFHNVLLKVESILEEKEAARDSDFYLVLKYWAKNHNLVEEIGLDAYKKIKAFGYKKGVPKFSSISRARRKIQASGKYPGKYRLSRLEKAEKAREYFSGEASV